MPFQLDTERERRVRESLQRLAEAEHICTQGVAAGYDMSAQELACAYYRDRLQRIIDSMGGARPE